MTDPNAADADHSDIEALQRGDDTALNRLMQRWQVPLRSFLYRLTQNEFDANDIAQETFVRVYQNRARFRTGARFSTWLFTIASNLARDRARRLKVRGATSLDDAPELIDEHQPSHDSETREKIEAVRAAVAELPHDLRTAVLLSEYERLSHAEIAAITSTTAKAIETRLYRARQQLKKTLQRWLSDQADPRALKG